MPNYCTLLQLQSRLTEAGLRFVADRNKSGGVSSDESADYLDTALAYASNLIDAALCGIVPPAVARAAGNAWLADRAVDLAAHRAASHGGREPPAALSDACRQAFQLLERVQQRQQCIPGLIIPQPRTDCQLPCAAPRVVNPSED